MQDRFEQEEQRDGVRLCWNIWPPTRLDSTRIVLPMGVVYSPLKQTKDLHLVNYEPLQCYSQKRCGAYLNPFAVIDFTSKCWICPFCEHRNMLPGFYADRIAPNNLPAEKQFTTVEYLLPNISTAPPCFLFILDTACNSFEDKIEFERARDTLQQALQHMPTNALVGFITFGSVVNVHELGFHGIARSHAFKGDKDYSPSVISKFLGLGNSINRAATDPHGGHLRKLVGPASRFLCPVTDCEFILNGILDEIRPDRWQDFHRRGEKKNSLEMMNHRPVRCTGAALSIGIGLMECAYSQSSARIILMTSGPCTVGPGQVVSIDKTENLRSHQDIRKNTAKWVKNATFNYAKLAKRASKSGHAVDIFACSLDQIGTYEMRVLCERTGGILLMSDSFSMHVFRDSFLKLFTKVDETGFLQMGFNARVTTVLSHELKVSGALGPISSTGKRHPSVGETSIGECDTIEWSSGVLDRTSTICFFLERSRDAITVDAQCAYVQFQTIYNDAAGRKRLRVTTISRVFSDAKLVDIAGGFDQEAAAVLLAKHCTHSLEHMEQQDVVKRLDQQLVRLVSRFGEYNKGDIRSFQLAPEFTMFPQFIFNFRRSYFMKEFGCSPDETAFYRSTFLRENIANSLVMIQPSLMEYSFESLTPEPVMLDSSSLKPRVILLLDTFFHVVVWRGDTIQKWYDQGYYELDEYVNFKALLEAPAKDALSILHDRFPVPKFIQTYANGSQARFLMNRVNPSINYSMTLADSQGGGGGDQDVGAVVLTEDVGLKTFIEALISMAVASDWT